MSSGIQVATSPELSESLGSRDNIMKKSYFGSAKENADNSEDSPRKFQRQTSQNKHVQQFRNPKFTQAQKRRATSFSTFEGKFLPHFNKRRKKDDFLQARNFLLGGSITDPLNLGSLADEEVNRSLNESTPKTSPLPTPRHKMFVEVLIPPNINDPLNLSAGNDAEDLELNLISPKMNKRKNKKLKRQNSGGAGDNLVSSWEETEKTSVKESQNTDVEPPKAQKPRLGDHESSKTAKAKRLENKIVSPVVPQTRAWKNARKDGDVDAEKTMDKPAPKTAFKPHAKQQENKMGEVFQYGNYNRYYGYRNINEPDQRLCHMKKEWFEGKDVLDVGCNVGFVTLQIARDFAPKKILGVDIDKRLIKVANKNIKHYLSTSKGNKKDSKFPISLPICHGPIAAPAIAKTPGFPNNIMFVAGNYVLENDALLELEEPKFDTILCLSITKWVHLNWGDEGLKRLFKRIYRQLRPGGIMLLEAQAWRSYLKKKKLLPSFLDNLPKIQLRPEKFAEYLKSRDVGFAYSHVIDIPYNNSRGFRRPLVVFTKPSSPRRETPSATVTSEPEKVEKEGESSQQHTTSVMEKETEKQ